MKTIAVTATVLAGLSMVSGTAFAQTGSIGVNYARADSDLGDSDSYGIDGEAIFDTGAPWAVIVEGDFTETDDTNGVGALEGHLINRGANSAWGVFVGAADTEGSTVLSTGFEYAQFFETSTLAFNLNFASDNDVDVEGYGANAKYSIFSGDNLRFDLGVGVGRVDALGNESDFVAIGAGFEYRFDGSPYSVGAGYTRFDSDANGAEADVLGVTLRWNFGDTTLKAADRSGKTFSGLGSALAPF
jgi:hypothetical protein